MSICNELCYFICNYYKVRYLYSVLLCLIGRYKCTSTLSYMHLYKGTNTNIWFYWSRNGCFLSFRNYNKIFNVFRKKIIATKPQAYAKLKSNYLQEFQRPNTVLPIEHILSCGHWIYFQCWKYFPSCLLAVWFYC